MFAKIILIVVYFCFYFVGEMWTACLHEDIIYLHKDALLKETPEMISNLLVINCILPLSLCFNGRQVFLNSTWTGPPGSKAN